MVSESGDRQKMAHSAHSMLNNLAGMVCCGRLRYVAVRHGMAGMAGMGKVRWVLAR